MHRQILFLSLSFSQCPRFRQSSAVSTQANMPAAKEIPTPFPVPPKLQPETFSGFSHTHRLPLLKPDNGKAPCPKFLKKIKREPKIFRFFAKKSLLTKLAEYSKSYRIGLTYAVTLWSRTNGIVRKMVIKYCSSEIVPHYDREFLEAKR